ncbi:MAG: hypothetical protein ACFFAO_06865 [Candidatus Hermodarchaeota archaeon]
MQDIKKWFQKAGVPVVVEKDPISSNSLSVNNTDIFQMSIDIKGKKNRKEYFRMFLGNEENDIRVIDADPKHQQVILSVHEPYREYIVRVWNFKERKFKEELQSTPDFLRKYLMGMDESHLFISELPTNFGPINSVKDAHKALKPNLVVKKEKKTSRIKRQGEWFFIPASSEELNLIEENNNFIEKKAPIDRNGGNLHIADKILNIRNDIFVTGKICHVEHHTLKLHGWFRVIRNVEVRGTPAGNRRIYNWVD